MLFIFMVRKSEQATRDVRKRKRSAEIDSSFHHAESFGGIEIRVLCILDEIFHRVVCQVANMGWILIRIKA